MKYIIDLIKESLNESFLITLFDLGKVVCIVLIIYYLYRWMMNAKKGSTKLYFSAMAYVVFEMIIKAKGG